MGAKMKSGINRRSLLKGLGLGASAAAFGGPTALSKLAMGAGPEGPDLYYVFAYFSGGWDILLGLDPRDPALFNAENERETRIQPGYDLLVGSDGQLVRRGDMTFGPYIGDLADHADKLAVIRGMSMETLSHEAGRRRFITGKPPSGQLARGSSIATHMAAKMGESNPIPNLALRVETYNVDEPNYATGLKANGVPDLLRALRPTDPLLPDRQDAQLDQLLKTVARCDHAQQSKKWQAAEAARLKARDMVKGDLASLFDFRSAANAGLRDRFGIPNSNAGLATSGAQAAMAARAIMGGVSRSVSVQITSGLDTHFTDWTRDQGPRQQNGFNAVARLIEELEGNEFKGTGDSWLDHTVIVGFSEFSRTSMLNDRGGRDHSLTNASFVVGAGIQGGQVIGASSDRGLEPTACNLETGRPELGGEVIRPEHVMQTLMHNAGFTDDEVDLRVGPIPALRR